MSGYVGDLSPSQENSLQMFRHNLSDVLKSNHDDHLLLQFLRAKLFNLEIAEAMFRKHLEFRKDFDEEYFGNVYVIPELILKHVIPPLLGYDKEGSPVYIINVGSLDIRGILSSFKRPELRKCVVAFLDADNKLLRLRSKETGVHVETRTIICDLYGLSLRQIFHRDVYDCTVSLLKLYEENYPENLKVAFIVNSPPFFVWAFNVIKPFISENTFRKLKIYGHSGWKKDLLQLIDPAILPVIYGGTRRDDDGDPRCRKLIPQGGLIPAKYYLRNRQRLSQDDEKVHHVIVKRQSKHPVPITINITGSTICWEVDCKYYDIHFCLLFLNGNIQEIVESVMVSSDVGIEKGFYLAERPGEYTLLFDNSYSIFRSKTVLFKVEISMTTVDNYQKTYINNKN